MRFLLNYHLTIFLFSSFGFSTIHYIPGDFQTIMGGIYNSLDGDTVLVSQGTYFENVDFLGKIILVSSEFLFSGDFNAIDNTIINGDQSGSVVTFDQGEQYPAQLIGFKITNGYGAGVGDIGTGGGITIKSGSNPVIEFCKIDDNSSLRGGGILIHYSDPVIKNCWIRHNLVLGDLTDNFGGGIFATHSDFVFQNLILSENETGRTGGAIALRLCDGTMENVLIYGNHAVHTAGAIDFSSSNTDVNHVTLTGNTAGNNGGAINSWYSDSNPMINNSIIWGNTLNNINTGAGASVTMEYSNLEETWAGEGNINADPFFISPNTENYFLSEFSLCINAGNPNDELDPDGSVTDMGIYVDMAGFFCEGSYQGDLNGDTEINVIDILIIANCITGLDCPAGNSCEFWNYNINNDSNINVLDILTLVTFILEQ